MPPPRQSVPLAEIRAPAVVDDQMDQAAVQSQTEQVGDMEAFVSLMLSQLRIAQGSRGWNQPPAPVEGPTAPIVEGPYLPGAGQRITEEVLAGPYDGVGTTYQVAHVYRPADFRLDVNGVGQTFGPTNDYVMVESGGPGTGFDAVSFTQATPPGPRCRVRATYVRLA